MSVPETPIGMLSIKSHVDAEIFLIGNDRQLLARGVGELMARRPYGIYKIKVTRGDAAVERLVDLSDARIDLSIDVPGLDTVVPFARGLKADTRDRLEELALRARKRIVGEHANLLLVGRSPTSGDLPRPLAGIRLLSWRDGDAVAALEPQEDTIEAQHWGVAALRLAPGGYILETNDGVHTSQQIIPVVSDWQTRVFLRLEAPPHYPGGGHLSPEGAAKARTPYQPGQRLLKVAVHLSRDERPIPLEEENETSEVARLALAMGRRIVRSREIVSLFLDDRFTDPLAGVASAHLMLDALDHQTSVTRRGKTEAVDLPLHIDQQDVATIIQGLASLLAVPQRPLPDLTALKLRAGIPLDPAERQLVEPPVYAASWQALLDAALGATPIITIDPPLFTSCANNYEDESYFAWIPREAKFNSYIENVIQQNVETLDAADRPASFRPVKSLEGLMADQQATTFFADQARIPRAVMTTSLGKPR